MSKTEKAPSRFVRWYWGATFITSGALTVVVNAAHARGVLALPGTWTAVAVAACPPALFIILTEGYFLVRRSVPKAAQRVVILSVGVLCAATFAVSYETSRTFVIAQAGPLPAWVGWVIPAMLDLTVGVSTYVLYVLSQHGDASAETTKKTRTPGRFARIGDNLLSRVETASAAKPKPAVTANAPSSAANITPVAATDHSATRTPSAEPMSWDNAANAALSAAPSAGSDRSNAVWSATPGAVSAEETRSRSAGNAAPNAVPTRHRDATPDAGDPTRALAEQIRTTAKMRTPVGQIAAVLAADDEQPDRPAERVAELAGIKHHSTVTRIRETRAQVESTAVTERVLTRLGA